jgi:hypothetical protein
MSGMNFVIIPGKGQVMQEENWEKVRKDQKLQLMSLMLFCFALRVVFLHWNQGEYTDGILQITLFTTASKNTFFMPLYTILATGANFLIHDLETSAKLVSMIAGVLGILPIYWLSRRLFNHRTGLYAAILYTISPEIWRWQIRVMTDSLFCTLFLWSVYHIYVLLEHPFPPSTSPPSPLLGKERDEEENLQLHLGLAWLAGGLATLTRYQGLGLLPLLVLAGYYGIKKIKSKIENNRSVAILFLIYSATFLVWFAIPTWWLTRGMGHIGQYSERMTGDWTTTLGAYLIMAEGFVAFLPYVVTYPIFLFAVYGFFKSYHQGKRFHIFYGIFLYLFLIWLTAHAPFQSFQFRYFIPIISLLLIPAAYGMTYFESAFSTGFWTGIRRRWVCFLAVSFCLAFSASSLFLQKETFGDIKESAIYMKEHLAGKRIWDNEQYRPGVNNVKVGYWSGLPINYYNINEIQPGDYVCLHNMQININQELTRLNQKFIIIPEANFRTQTIPLLPDIMVNPPVTSRPEALLYKYFPQNFLSVIIRVEKRNALVSGSP